MITVRINGTPQQVMLGTTAATLLSSLGMAQQRLALEINAAILPRSAYAQYCLQADDCIEIVQAIGGG